MGVSSAYLVPFSGELVLWDLNKAGKQRWTLFGTSSEGQNHNRIVFNMSSVQARDGRELLISTSMDREVGGAGSGVKGQGVGVGQGLTPI